MSDQSVNLDMETAIKMLLQSIEIAQRHGTFVLSESEILKKCKDAVLGESSEVDISQARQVLVQGVVKGQSRGAYSLEEAAVLHKVCAFVLNSAETSKTDSKTDSNSNSKDLEELSAPVPLMPKEI